MKIYFLCLQSHPHKCWVYLKIFHSNLDALLFFAEFTQWLSMKLGATIRCRRGIHFIKVEMKFWNDDSGVGSVRIDSCFSSLHWRSSCIYIIDMKVCRNKLLHDIHWSNSLQQYPKKWYIFLYWCLYKYLLLFACCNVIQVVKYSLEHCPRGTRK